MSRRSFSSLLIVLLAGSVVSGCGGPQVPPGAIVTGRLVSKGQPLELLRPEVGLGMVEIRLIPDGAKGGEEVSKTDKEGRFEIRGPGNGVPAGKYKLAIKHWKQGMGTKDELEGRFSADKTPIVVEVPAKSLGSTYDLGELELTSYEDLPASGEPANSK